MTTETMRATYQQPWGLTRRCGNQCTNFLRTRFFARRHAQAVSEYDRLLEQAAWQQEQDNKTPLGTRLSELDVGQVPAMEEKD
jgi:hypothetical protein